MPYHWNHLRFEVPAGMVDQTVVTLVDNPDAPSFTVSISADTKGTDGFPKYVEAQLADLARSLPGYASVSRKDATVGNRSALLVEHRARSGQGMAMRQRQAYVDGTAGIAIVTLTCADKPNTQADAAFDNILKTLGT